MNDATANALPFPNSNRRAAQTTPADYESVPWVTVAANLLPMEANIIKSRLDSMNVPALVNQESIGAVMGLTIGPLGSASVLVPEPLADAALEILAETFEPVNDETGE